MSSQTTPSISTLGICHTPQAWINDYAVDVDGEQTYDLTALATTDAQARELFERLAGGEDIDDFEYDVREVLGEHFGLDHDGPFYVRPVIDGLEAEKVLDDDQIEAVRLWLKEHPLTPAEEPASEDEPEDGGVRRVGVRELLRAYREDGELPYAIVSESTGGYAVIQGGVEEKADGTGFVIVDTSLGSLYLPLDEGSEAITVVDTRAAALAMTRPAAFGAQLTAHASQLGEDRPTLVVTVDTAECSEDLRVRVNVNDAPVADLVPETGLDLLEA